METKKLNAKHLKEALWETLIKVKDEKMDPGQADSIATQAREIIRTTNTQLRIAHQTKRDVPVGVIDFSEKES